MPASSDLSFATPIEKIIEALATNTGTGLSPEEAQQRIAEYGHNRIESKKEGSLLLIFLRQFINVMVYLLAFAAAVSFFFEEWLDGTAILVVIFVNAIIGFFMEWQAKRSMDALKKMVTVPAKVFRGSHLTEISSEDVVPGDILFIEAGDMIAADARVIDDRQLQVDESALTGESLPVEKQAGILPEKITLAERTNMVYKGTFATKGNGHALVVGTGMKTELGAIATLVDSAEQTATPLERKLEEFSKKLIWVTVALVVIIFIVGIINGHRILIMLETAIALAVAAIPEGLPIVSTLALASGMMKLARQNVIVKKLVAVETLGGTNIICTDKTGTLTQNRIEVNTLCTVDGTYEIKETISHTVTIPSAVSSLPSFKLLQRIAVLCNTAAYHEKDGKIHEVGDPLETGLLKFVHLTEGDIGSIRNEYPKVHEKAFNSDTKIMGTLHSNKGAFWAAAKGATEELIANCTHAFRTGQVVPLTDEDKKGWLNKGEEMARAGLRVLAFSFREIPTEEKEFMHDLIFVGLIGFLDPARADVPQAVAECHSAGIRVVMITGDHPFTARNIAHKLGITGENDAATVNGADMHDYAQLSAAEKKVWIHSSVFARVSPKQKLDLVTVLQNDNNIVGMTGDGVNDAPALKKADIGIAMGLRGTQVAQEVADMILKDDSFSSIVKAIRQGRIIFENIQKFVMFLLSCNMSELFVVALAAVLNLSFQLVPLQILFINIVTDVLPALALGVSSGNDIVMKQMPRDPKAPLMDSRHWRSMITYSAVITIFVIGAVFVSRFLATSSNEPEYLLSNNILFFTLIYSQLFHVFNMTFGWVSPFKSEVVRNKYIWYAMAACAAITYFAYSVSPINIALDVQPMGWASWGLVLGASTGSLITIQLLKRLKIIL